MYYNQFIHRLHETKGIKKRTYCHGVLIEQDEHDLVYVNGDETMFETLDEARASILKDIEAKKIAESAVKDSYEEYPENKIVSVIRKHSTEKITDTLIENYRNLASSHVFTIDPIVCELRSLNKVDQLIEGKTHFVLDDNSVVALSEETIGRLNSLLVEQDEIVSYMKENKDNFVHVVSLLEK